MNEGTARRIIKYFDSYFEPSDCAPKSAHSDYRSELLDVFRETRQKTQLSAEDLRDMVKTNWSRYGEVSSCNGAELERLLDRWSDWDFFASN